MHIVFIAIIAFCCIIILTLLFLLKKIHAEIIIDPQSKLKNYRWLKKKVQSLINKQKDASLPFSILIIDIDNFRRFNLHGIEEGDEVLYKFASQLNKLVLYYTGSSDVVRYRLGDEFAIIFSNFSHTEVIKLTNKILQSFKQNSIQTSFLPDAVFITFKFGISEYKNGDSLSSILKRAENDLVSTRL